MCRYKMFDKSSPLFWAIMLPAHVSVYSFRIRKAYISCYFIFIITCAGEFTHKSRAPGRARVARRNLTLEISFFTACAHFKERSKLPDKLGISSEYAQSISKAELSSHSLKCCFIELKLNI